MLDKLEQIKYKHKDNAGNLNTLVMMSCWSSNWSSLISEYDKIKQQLLQQLNEQVRPNLTDDEWTMLLIQVNSCPEVMQYLPAASESFVPF